MRLPSGLGERVVLSHSASPSWTLESELKSALGAATAHEAFHRCGICAHGHVGCTYATVHEWQRSGSETYTYVFDVLHGTGGRQRVVLKACVASAPLGSVGQIAEEWRRRRSLLSDAGVDTPTLYYLHRAVFMEEWISLTLEEAFIEAPPETRRLLGRKLGALAHTLMIAGFPVTSFYDLRSRGDDVVVVDFGEDLGPPHAAPSASADLVDIARAEVRGWHSSVRSSAEDALLEGYAEASLLAAGPFSEPQ